MGKEHYIALKALAYESRQHGLGAVDSDFLLQTNYTPPTSQKWEDIAVRMSISRMRYILTDNRGSNRVDFPV